jgi:hypothetical protein
MAERRPKDIHETPHYSNEVRSGGMVLHLSRFPDTVDDKVRKASLTRGQSGHVRVVTSSQLTKSRVRRRVRRLRPN